MCTAQHIVWRSGDKVWSWFFSVPFPESLGSNSGVWVCGQVLYPLSHLIALIHNYFPVYTPRGFFYTSSYFSKLPCESSCLHYILWVSLPVTRRSHCWNNVCKLENCTGSNESLWHMLRPLEHSYSHSQFSAALGSVTRVYFMSFSSHQMMLFTPMYHSHPHS